MTDQEKESLISFYYGDGSLSRTPLTKLVDKMLIPYGGISSDHTDFYSVANETFVRCLESYDETKGAKFETYLSNCLSSKIKTQFSYVNRDKRKNKDDEGNFIPDESLDRIIGTENNGDTTVGSMIMDRKQNVERILLEDSGKDLPYMEVLHEPIQKKIAKCWIDGLSHTQTREALGIEVGEYNRIVGEMRQYDKIKYLRKGRAQKSHKTNTKEANGMFVAKTSNNADKSKLEVVTISTLIKDMDNAEILTNHPLQREPNQWTSEYKGNLITTILNNYKFSPLVACQEYKGETPYNWLIDGKQRSTVIYEYRSNLFKVSKKALHTVMSYQVTLRDENGKIITDEQGYPLKETRTFDVADKKFSDLPSELQNIFDNYMVSIERYLNCTEEEIQYHIIRYNDAKPMSASNKGTLKLGEEFAQAMKGMVNEAPLFNEYKEMTGFATAKKDILYRMVVESIMGSFYLDNWNKTFEKNCEFLAKNGTVGDFEEFNMIIDSLTQVIDEETGKLFNVKNSFIWIAVFNEFLTLMNDDSSLKYDDFNGFMKEFQRNLINEEVNGITFADLEEKSSKGSKEKPVVIGKVNHLVTLLKKYLGKDDDGTKEPIKADEVKEEVVEETTESSTKEVVEYTVNVEAEEKTVDSTETEEPTETGDDPVFKYIDTFAENELVKKLGGTDREINRAAIVTAIMLESENRRITEDDLSDEGIRKYIEEKDFSDCEELMNLESENMEKIANWSMFTIGKSGFVTVENLPILVCLAKYSRDKALDEKKCKSWFETFAFTYANKGLDGTGYLNILKFAIEDMSKSCTPSAKRTVIF